MACKFIVKSAFKAHLLLRPSCQRTNLFGTVYKLGRPIAGQYRWPLILSSRTYSEFTPTPPTPKASESTEGSQSPKRRDKNWSLPSWIAPSLGGAIATAGAVSIGPVLRYLKSADY
jgi:hypothetical protein